MTITNNYLSEFVRRDAQCQNFSRYAPTDRPTAIERPACPNCQAEMMLARIVPAFLGTDLRGFECAVCNRILNTLGAYDDQRCATLA